jgi:hypothetical protein
MIMKKLFSSLIFTCLFISGYSQVDTISQNIYQLNGKIGIGGINYGGYFNPALKLFNGWLQVSSSDNHDAGLVISHEHKYGYGFARTLHMVFEDVTGDPYTEFRIRHTSDEYTVTSWAIGAENQNDDKLIISNDVNTLTGASPSIGNKVVAIKITGEFGIGTTDPKARLEVANGDVYISEIDRGIIMRSPDGQCWRGTLDNQGSLRFAPIDCPELITTVQPIKTSDEILIYPNPTDGKITIGVKDNNLKDLSIKIFDLDGKMLNAGKIESNFKTVDISEYISGTYILTVNDKNGAVLSSNKIIKK